MHFGGLQKMSLFFSIIWPPSILYHPPNSCKGSWYKKSHGNFTVVILEMNLLH